MLAAAREALAGVAHPPELLAVTVYVPALVSASALALKFKLATPLTAVPVTVAW